MGERYLRRFECEDCGRQVERMWQTPRPLICVPCGAVRHEVATRGAIEALEAHKRACRLELLVLRAARPSEHPLLGVLEQPARHGTVGSGTS